MDLVIPVKRWFFWHSSEGQTESLPKPDFISAMQARRLSKVDKLALYSLTQLNVNLHNVATVFASQHGQLQRTCKIMQQMAIEKQVSPTQFSTSVHNTAAGLFSIAAHNTEFSTSIAAGGQTFSAALIESLGVYRDSGKNVALVLSDFPPEEPLTSFNELNFPAFSLGLSIGDEPEFNLIMRVDSGTPLVALYQQAKTFNDLLIGQESEANIGGWRVRLG